MWGQEVLISLYIPTFRIIPTRVGTSLRSCSKNFCQEDHPHACGDKTYFVGNATASLGSSPRVWGQEITPQMRIKQRGIIPTRVGTRTLYPSFAGLPQDHPHACGDKFAAVASFHSNSGSSPRVWGQVGFLHQIHQEARIIPTRVGTSLLILHNRGV